jgi:hypothetical protein
MNILLWVLQIILALKFISVTFSHGLRPDETKMERGVRRLGRLARPLLILTALGTFLLSVGLILPAATGILPWLTPWSAALLAISMILATGFHISCREEPKIWASLIILVLAAFVAYGRWALAPL